MKKTTLLLLTLAFLAMGAAAQNKTDKQGRRQGHWIRTDRGGAKIYEGDFVDGQETGTFTYYYTDGTVRIRNIYSEPGKRCTHEAYDEQGHLLARGEYNQRNRDGQWQFFAEDGRLVKEASYKMGVKDGQHVIYDRKGDTAEVTHWQDNRKHGRWWKRIGNTGYITANYVRGGVEGHLLEYDDNGQMVRDGEYKEGMRHGKNLLYENNELVAEEDWQHGVMTDRKILLNTAKEKLYISIHDIACMAPRGNSKTLVFMTDSTEVVANEESDIVYNRAGGELFSLANRKNRIMVANSRVQGIGKDGEGREILLLEPQPPFAIFPDEDCHKLVESLRPHPLTPSPVGEGE
ncbi:MAG: hypothetical protein IIU16_03280 [Bacteroidales bacterium]|nr:hypothetical protein [Bacteroidales bacterium]